LPWAIRLARPRTSLVTLIHALRRKRKAPWRCQSVYWRRNGHSHGNFGRASDPVPNREATFSSAPPSLAHRPETSVSSSANLRFQFVDFCGLSFFGPGSDCACRHSQRVGEPAHLRAENPVRWINSNGLIGGAIVRKAFLGKIQHGLHVLKSAFLACLPRGHHHLPQDIEGKVGIRRFGVLNDDLRQDEPSNVFPRLSRRQLEHRRRSASSSPPRRRFTYRLLVAS